jgi:hypothetical protein
MDKIKTCPLGGDKDKPIWNLTKFGLFTIKSLHNTLHDQLRKISFKYLWKGKNPTKI